MEKRIVFSIVLKVINNTYGKDSIPFAMDINKDTFNSFYFKEMVNNRLRAFLSVSTVSCLIGTVTVTLLITD